eukprot:1151551-Pelagomonas_calceolata.AAC.4
MQPQWRPRAKFQMHATQYIWALGHICPARPTRQWVDSHAHTHSNSDTSGACQAPNTPCPLVLPGPHT